MISASLTEKESSLQLYCLEDRIKKIAVDLGVFNPSTWEAEEEAGGSLEDSQSCLLLSISLIVLLLPSFRKLLSTLVL